MIVSRIIHNFTTAKWTLAQPHISLRPWLVHFLKGHLICHSDILGGAGGYYLPFPHRGSFNISHSILDFPGVQILPLLSCLSNHHSLCIFCFILFCYLVFLIVLLIITKSIHSTFLPCSICLNTLHSSRDTLLTLDILLLFSG